MPRELLFRDINSLSFDKECFKSRLPDCVYSSFKQVSKISDKNRPEEDIKALKNLIEKDYLVIKKLMKAILL